MKKEPFFSIIIPLYNTECYVEECLNSIKNQTYKDFEVIIIDDGSDDKGFDKSKSIILGDDRFKIYKQKNRGVCFTRNIGLAKAKGKYIIFIDSDDYIKTDMLDLIKDKCEKDALLSFGYIKKYKNIEKCFSDKMYTFDNTNDILKQILYNESISGFVWNKVFSLKLIRDNNIKFNSQFSFSEDLLFCLEYIRYAKKLINVETYPYYYRMRKSSVTYNFVDKKNLEIFKLNQLLRNMYGKNGQMVKFLDRQHIINYYKLKHVMNPKEKKIYALNTEYKSMSIIEIIKIKLLYSFPILYNNISKFKNFKYKYFN